jgi:hypothetical protein
MSCKFCEGLFDEEYKMIWNMRSSYADDNFCEKVLNNTCENCQECNVDYILNGWKSKETGNTYIQCNYKFNNGDIIMWNYTEPLRINYCPYCARQLANDLVNYEDIGNHISDIENDKCESWNYEDYKIKKEFNIE